MFTSLISVNICQHHTVKRPLAGVANSQSDQGTAGAPIGFDQYLSPLGEKAGIANGTAWGPPQDCISGFGLCRAPARQDGQFWTSWGIPQLPRPP